MTQRIRKAFTLIELLIVVAIIAILAAIAVPNFLEAQTRSKVSRTKADMRTMATALEAYHVDWNSYVNSNTFGTAMNNTMGTGNPNPEALTLERLSTPVAYLSSVSLRDPFNYTARSIGANAAAINANMAAGNTAPVQPTDVAFTANSYIYQAWNSIGRPSINTYLPSRTTWDSFNPGTPGKPSAWLLHSAGPDGIYYNLGGVIANDDVSDPAAVAEVHGLMYDPTNGTVSTGSIFRVGGTSGSNLPQFAGGSAILNVVQSTQQ